MVGWVIFIPGAGGDSVFWKPVSERVARDIELGLVFRCVPPMVIRGDDPQSGSARLKDKSPLTRRGAQWPTYTT